MTTLWNCVMVWLIINELAALAYIERVRA